MTLLKDRPTVTSARAAALRGSQIPGQEFQERQHGHQGTTPNPGQLSKTTVPRS